MRVVCPMSELLVLIPCIGAHSGKSYKKKRTVEIAVSLWQAECSNFLSGIWTLCQTCVEWVGCGWMSVFNQKLTLVFSFR